LHSGRPEDAGVAPAGIDAIRRECQRWYDETKEPFAVLLARHSIVFLHESFGMEKERPTSVASITKALTGLMFAQFLDQRLISLDDPVGKFLPGFPTQGGKTLTLRHCFTHTSGLSGHGEWGGMHNPWLDSVIANGLEYLEPGTEWGYTGMGFELGGKVMEIVAGKSIGRLFYEHFFGPLGIRTFYVEDLGGGARLNVEELGRVAQLLLNRGVYGDRQFFSPQTFELLKPQPLTNFYPGVDHQYGIGLCWRNVEPWMVEQFALDKTKSILGKNVIGHDGASGAILRADFDNDLVVVQARDHPAANYDAHLIRFLEVTSSALTK
jgi:CubicO group peptidase (beta-lactamase class C family)